MSIRTATFNKVLTIEIARPEKKNALTQAMYSAMADALTSANTDAGVRAVLITGQPGVFTSGNDIEDFMQQPPAIVEAGEAAQMPPVTRFMHALLDCEKPVVAAVTGAAVGIGSTMLLHCDLVYVSDEARLAMPFVSLGLVPEYASSLLLPALLGHVKATEKLMLGEPFSGSDAVDCGIANAVLPASEVVNHARRMAERFNNLPPQAVRETKRLMREPQKARIHEVMAAEAALFGARLRSPEAMEAFQAFFQKRKPDFSQF
jgi:enoyl-CoA hydratase/carnithine racemase